MRIFFGGQITRERRGDLAAVVSRQQTGQGESPVYDVFVYPTRSEEFDHLTGVRAVNHLLERVYIGVSVETGGQIATLVNGRRADEIDLRTIDELVAVPHFLDKPSDKPGRIVLEATPQGYKVVNSD